MVTSTTGRGWTRRGDVRVPLTIGAGFWVLKALSTALGEATSDWAVHAVAPVLAVLVGFLGFLATLVIQLSRRRFVPWAYWLAVCGVGVFGTMAADVVHVGLHVPYAATSVLYAVGIVAVFTSWRRVEGTVSIHSIDTARRELFYWAAVVATFALGTAVGDLSAISLHLGYGGSIALFLVLLLIPSVLFYGAWLGPVPAFWAAYVVTRPLGASVADYLGKPAGAGGRGWGDGPVAGALVLAIVVLVAALSSVSLRREPASARSPLGA